MDAQRTIAVINAGIELAGNLLGYIGTLAHKSGAVKLGSELVKVGQQVGAFRTDPVLQAEIEALRLEHTWPSANVPVPEPTPLPTEPTPEPGKGG